MTKETAEAADTAAEASLFTPARVGRAVEDVVLQIEAAIVGGRIAPGQSLPSERDLALRFGTGRGVVREALRALKQKDLVEIRKGAKGGAFVKKVEMASVSEPLALFLSQHAVGADHVIEFRESMDRTLTTLAAARGSAEEKRLLLEEAEALALAAHGDAPDQEALGEMDRGLNMRLAQLSGNPVFEWVMHALQLGFSSLDHALYADPGFRVRTADNWVDTAREIAAGEPLRALSFVGLHYALLRRCVEEKGLSPRGADFLAPRAALNSGR
ncbi:FadR/GntR family transcriptional regulator [Desulfovibrio sp. X2]|uniref:FadR/GntR family transcriptional regulator n=1 Tax=Desulfovibrio sp. X2 TaxID=941449 RepID=UPI00068AC922|nr:GntR family transcriptional regulator [Desulfovibrio sp. X2]